MGEAALTDDALRAGLEAMEPDRIQGFHYPPRFVIRDVFRPVGEQEIWSCEDLSANHEAFLAQCRLENFRIGYLAVTRSLKPILTREALARHVQDSERGGDETGSG